MKHFFCSLVIILALGLLSATPSNAAEADPGVAAVQQTQETSIGTGVVNNPAAYLRVRMEELKRASGERKDAFFYVAQASASMPDSVNKIDLIEMLTTQCEVSGFVGIAMQLQQGIARKMSVTTGRPENAGDGANGTAPRRTVTNEIRREFKQRMLGTVVVESAMGMSSDGRFSVAMLFVCSPGLATAAENILSARPTPMPFKGTETLESYVNQLSLAGGFVGTRYFVDQNGFPNFIAASLRAVPTDPDDYDVEEAVGSLLSVGRLASSLYALVQVADSIAMEWKVLDQAADPHQIEKRINLNREISTGGSLTLNGVRTVYSGQAIHPLTHGPVLVDVQAIDAASAYRALAAKMNMDAITPERIAGNRAAVIRGLQNGESVMSFDAGGTGAATHQRPQAGQMLIGGGSNGFQLP